jgi:aminoglycoside phosphotransferase (APT) family kinase protein
VERAAAARRALTVDSRPVVEAVTAAVARRVPEWYGAGAVALPAAGVETRRYSFFLRYPVVSPAGRARVLVKVPRPLETDSFAAAATEPASPDAAREYETLVAIREALVGPESVGLRAVRPLGFLEPWNAFAMEEVPGRNLKRLVTSWAVLRRSPRAWIRVERAYRSAGRWLARFHDCVGAAHPEPLDTQRLHRLAEAAVDRLDRAAAGRQETASLRRAIGESIDALASASDRVACLHGDFRSAHILLAPDARLAVLDSYRAAPGSVYEEVARLATDLSTLGPQALSHGLAYRERDVRRCVDAHLRGYFGDRPPDRALLAVHCGLAVLRKWADDEERLAAARLPRVAGRALSWWIGRWHRRRLLAGLER